MTKEELREKVWTVLEKKRVARFPGARGRIPNFKGAEKCAELVAQFDVWQRAKVIKANPDSPQRAIRYLALKQGKAIYMAVPASSIKGAFEFGRQISVKEMKPVDLILCGSVAVRRNGARIGKGGGYSDLEFAIALEAGIIGRKTPIITTVHPLQIVDYKIDLNPYDIPVDFIITPDEIVRTRTRLSRPKGIYWQLLDEEKIGAIPLLQKLKRRR